MEVVIVSGDKDLMQLVSDDVIMVDTMKDKTYDVAAVKERFGVGPEKVVEILGLMGDASDNIPGVPGIGPKGALRLIEQFGGVEEILAHPEKIHNAKTREAILANADQARLSRELARIRTDAVVAFDLEACRRREPDRELLISLFQEFEFSSLLQEFEDPRRKPPETTGSSGRRRSSKRSLGRLGRGPGILQSIRSSPLRRRCGPRSSALPSRPRRARRFTSRSPTRMDRPSFPSVRSSSALAPFLADPAVAKHGHDLKTAAIVLAEAGFRSRASAATRCSPLISSIRRGTASSWPTRSSTTSAGRFRRERGRRERREGRPVYRHTQGKDRRTMRAGAPTP